MSAAAPTTRFELVRRLGEGAAGVVYEALDRARGTRVAVKTLRSMTSESHARLQRELASLRDVHHANLVTLGELVRDGDQTFLTMELVEGNDFIAYVCPRGRGVTQPGFDESRLRHGLRQLAEGLAALHEAGLVHRDVKPSNIRVTSEGRVVLLDFGLVLDEATDSPWTEHAAGTPAYMAPEQAISAKVGPEADWYAVGVLLFEALTGRVPFEGPPLQVLTRKQKEEPPAPSTIAVGIPPELDALCVALLRFNPQARPQDRHVLRALGSSAASAWRNALQTQETRFVGRAAELESLSSAFRDIRRGAPITVVVEGESGIGKSALVQRFAQRLVLEEPDVVFLSSRCHPGEGGPFRSVAAIVESLADFLASLDTASARAFVPAKPLPLAKMFPALRRVEAVAELARRPQPASAVLVGMRARALEGFRQLLASISAQRPLVLAVHDAQWMDEDSRVLLADLLRPADAPMLLLLVTARAAVSALSGEVRHLRLGALPPEDGRVLATAILAQGGVTDPVAAERCMRRARGDPFVLDLTALHAQHAALDTEGRVPVDDVVGRVLKELDPAQRAVLETIAVAGAPLPPDTIARATGMGGHQVARALSMLRVMHFAQAKGPPGGECVTLSHDRVGDAVIARLDSRRRTGLHRRIAVALETSDVRDAHLLAMHWRSAGDDHQMARYAELAGDEAVERLAFEHAGRCYELALSSSSQPDEERLALLTKLGEARANAGLGRAASEAFGAAAEVARGPRSLDLRRRAAQELLMAGDIEAGTRKLRDVAKRVRMWMPGSPRATIVALHVFRLVLWLRGMQFKPREEESIPTEDVTRIWVCAGVARLLSTVDPTLAEYFQTRMLLFALRCGSTYAVSYALLYEVIFLAARGIRTRRRAGQLLARADRLAQQIGEPRVKTLAAFARGVVPLMHGRPAEAVANLDQALTLALDSTASDYSATRALHVMSLWARALMGDIVGLSSRLNGLFYEAIDRGDLTTSTVVRVLPALVRGWLRDGDSRNVRAGIESAMTRWTHRAYDNYHHWASSSLTEVDLYEGLGRQAFERVSKDFSRARRTLTFIREDYHVPARHLRARSAILAAAQDPRPRERARLVAAAARDAQWLRRAPPDYARAWAALVEAGISALRGEREHAVAALEEGITGLDAIGVRFAAACARMRLGAYLGAADERGRALFAEGEGFMREQGVVDPQRTAAAIVPGVDPA